ncbi:hypothetical protein H0H92_006715 [Tricholoma furcatifolium]|nr:hypothetical protein H0H92_006715 [Tricholoma furcatifolium]
MTTTKKPWYAQRTLQETDAIITAPGSLHELENRYIDGRLVQVYKRLWPSMRVFWMWAASEHAKQDYVVLENQRLTFAETFEKSVKAAGVFRDVYGVKKDGSQSTSHVQATALESVLATTQIISWPSGHARTDLIGAVSTLVNAWLPLEPLRHCLTHTECKLIILDPERADRLEGIADEVKAKAGSTGILVLNAHEGKGTWKGMESWDAVLAGYKGDTRSIVTGEGEPEILPEDNATILFTSGTTGMPKGVLSTQRQYLSNLLNTLVGGFRAVLRKGDSILPVQYAGPQKGSLLSVPFFHATGSTSRMMMATLAGMKTILMRRWVPEEGVRLIKDENCTIAGGVPSMVLDLAETSIVNSDTKHTIEGLSFGGAPAPEVLAERATKLFPNAVLAQGYGLTETNSLAVGVCGDDYIARPGSTGLPMPINELKIVRGDVAVAPYEIGEVWIKGVNIMKGYWKDPDQAVTKDGWLKSGDVGYLDEDGFLYIKDRIKDIIIRGGENIDSTTVENAIYADERVMEAAAVAVPHERLGEVVAAVVSVKPAFAKGKVSEESLIAVASKSLPKFAVPVMIIIQDELLEKNASQKIIKAPLRKLAREEWEKRQSKPKSKL